MLAELEVCHTRPASPTRRVAIGNTNLANGFGPLLLGCIAGWYALGQDEDFFAEAEVLLEHAKRQAPIAQPHLRHRFQADLVGLSRSVHRLRRNHDSLAFDSQVKTDKSVPHVLGALYALAGLTGSSHVEGCRYVGAALNWAKRRSITEPDGELVPDALESAERHELVSYMLFSLPTGSAGEESNGLSSQTSYASWDWAMGILEFSHDELDHLTTRQIDNRYRELLKAAHPDKGGSPQSAPTRIANLAKARQILTG